ARADADEALQSAIDGEATARADADATLQSAIDGEAIARADADEALQSAVDNEVARATAQEAAIRNDFVAGDAATLAKANAYTDKKVDTLEKNVSGGVAAATALSSVAVSNVRKGEVSVGGGYGYYNNQSAVALGAAMGLTDRWSVNAGAGLATGDKTQMTFRAGTNYKFKLF
ncbi:MAG: YadA C-terminal domain-containing protein, partial [Alphaproteobacteria bacterium]|nr:YadA C-terminal domain-containing protein [Alphaproteobacteria bacterium]